MEPSCRTWGQNSPERCPVAQTGEVRDKAVLASGPWRPWTICVAGALALIASIVLLVGDGLAGVLASWDTPAPGSGWIEVAAAGHVVLLAASIVLLGAGLGRPAWRRAATVAAWAIIPVGLGWFVLCARLASGAA